MVRIAIDHNKENRMTEAEALMVINHLNKKEEIKPKTQREICLRACADEIARRIREGKYRKVSKYLWITDTSLTLIAKDGFKYVLKLQKGSIFSKRVQGETFGQEKFFLQDIIRWNKAQ